MIGWSMRAHGQNNTFADARTVSPSFSQLHVSLVSIECVKIHSLRKLPQEPKHPERQTKFRGPPSSILGNTQLSYPSELGNSTATSQDRDILPKNIYAVGNLRLPCRCIIYLPGSPCNHPSIAIIIAEVHQIISHPPASANASKITLIFLHRTKRSKISPQPRPAARVLISLQIRPPISPSRAPVHSQGSSPDYNFSEWQWLQRFGYTCMLGVCCYW